MANAGPSEKPVCRGGRLEDGELGGSELRVPGERGAQGAGIGELGQQDALALPLGELAVAGDDARLAEQLVQHRVMHVGVLPKVDGCEMKTERSHGFSKQSQPALGKDCVAAGAKRAIDHIERGRQLRAIGIAARASHGAAMGGPQTQGLGRRDEPRIDSRQRPPIRLILAMRRAVRRFIGQGHQFRRATREQGRERKLRAQCMDFLEIVVERDLAVTAQCLLEHLRRDERIAVAIASDPAPDGDQRG